MIIKYKIRFVAKYSSRRDPLIKSGHQRFCQNPTRKKDIRTRNFIHFKLYIQEGNLVYKNITTLIHLFTYLLHLFYIFLFLNLNKTIIYLTCSIYYIIILGKGREYFYFYNFFNASSNILPQST